MPVRFAAYVGARGHFFRCRFNHLHDVTAGGKSARTGARENHDMDVVVVFDLAEFFVEFDGKLVTERVEFLRAIHREERNFVDTLDKNVLVVHEFAPVSRRITTETMEACKLEKKRGRHQGPAPLSDSNVDGFRFSLLHTPRPA